MQAPLSTGFWWKVWEIVIRMPRTDDGDEWQNAESYMLPYMHAAGLAVGVYSVVWSGKPFGFPGFTSSPRPLIKPENPSMEP